MKDLKELEIIVNEKLVELKILASEYKLQNAEDGKWKVLGITNIDPAKLSLFGLAFNKIKLEIRAGVSEIDEAATIVLDYSWEHHRGSNGIDVRYSYRNNSWTKSD